MDKHTEPTLQPDVAGTVDRVLIFTKSTTIDLTKNFVCIKRHVFREMFDVNKSCDNRMLEIQECLLKKGIVIVSIGTERATEYLLTSNLNPAYSKAKTVTPEFISNVLNNRDRRLADVMKLMAIKLNSKLLAKSICDVAGHSSVAVLDKKGLPICLRCGCSHKKANLFYLDKQSTDFLFPVNITVNTKVLNCTADFELDVIDLLGVDVSKSHFPDMLRKLKVYMNADCLDLYNSTKLEFKFKTDSTLKVKAPTKSSTRAKLDKKVQSTTKKGKVKKVRKPTGTVSST